MRRNMWETFDTSYIYIYIYIFNCTCAFSGYIECVITVQKMTGMDIFTIMCNSILKFF